MEKHDKNNPLLDAAISYANRGWLILPLKPREKVPLGRLVQHGFLDASLDLETIRNWWESEPHANIGIRTGAESGLVVIDVDPRSGGDDSLYELEQKFGELPKTIESITGGGGQHIYLKHPGGFIKSAPIGLGLDIKADKGQVVAPPSLHPSGNSYLWEIESHPDDVKLATIPDWLMKFLSNGKSRLFSKDLPIVRIPAGRRNQILFSLAGSMRRRA